MKPRNRSPRHAIQRHRLVLLLACFVVESISFGRLSAQDYEREPIDYAKAPANNPITRLEHQLKNDATSLEFDRQTGYLKSLLKALDVPVESQTLVFSKTSLQRDRISPRTPRALYFNDDVYVGFCQRGEVLEISTADPGLGTVFYTLGQDPIERPQFVRQNDHCLSCHGSTSTRGVPGHLVRSVYSDRTGHPVLSLGTHRIDHSSSFDKRWGGWYVTGTHGQQTHLGNLMVIGTPQRTPVDNSDGQNVTNLDSRFDSTAYLSAHSDLIALMVLEHQAEAHNLLTRVNFQTREAHYSEARLNKDLGEPEGHRWDSTNTRIRSASEALVRYFLFSDEATLTSRVSGTTAFEQKFAERGPKDSKGRSLRDFDLGRRLFRYPCSYLIYSNAFESLPEEAKVVIYRRLWEVLTNADQSKPFAHLSADDRQSILEILRETKQGLPDYWSVAGAGNPANP